MPLASAPSPRPSPPVAALAAALLLALGLALPGRAGAASIAVVGDFDTGALYRIDLATGALRHPLSTGITTLGGLEVDGNGILYGLSTPGTGSPGALYTIDPDTGAASLVGSLGLSAAFEGGLAWDAATDTLYGVQDAPLGARRLLTVDLGTGAATLVGDVTNSADFSAISFDALGDLYLLETTGNELWRVDKATAMVQSVVSLSQDVSSLAGMAFDPGTGTMYVVDGATASTDNLLYTLNLSTGALSLVGSDATAVRLAGLAFVPEPGAAVLLAAAAALAATALRRS